jgi:hypothetical protein
MSDGRSIGAKVILALVLLAAGGFAAVVVFAHVFGRTTAEPPPGNVGGA